MLIRISGPAAVFDSNDELVTSADLLRQLDGIVYDDEAFTEFLGGPSEETAIALLLDHGGHLSFRFDESAGQLIASTEYRVVRPLHEGELKTLVNYTLGQWSDGIGENLVGESLDRFGFTIQCETDDVAVSQIDDGTPCEGNGAADLFRAVDSGDVADAISAIARCRDINARLAGCTPLMWAILHNQPEIAIALSQHCDVNASDATNATPLMSLACSQMSDTDTVLVANALIDAGALVNACNESGNTAATLARLRGKDQLHTLLLERGERPL